MKLRLFCVALLSLCAAGRPAALAAAPKVDFNRDVRPILAENCFHCHGADAAQRQADLRLDLREAALERGALTPGDASGSAVVQRINSADSELKMPPVDSQRKLAPDQIVTLTRWIAEGAEYEAHWAFQGVARPAPPEVDLKSWPQNAIDRFVLARLEDEALTPAPRAPLPTLLRRASFDLTGLPPTPQQIASWQTADDPLAAALDELLASPHFGERLATDWLDVARYADTHGFNNDSARTMWRWRDWVVDAFNANLPYDQFIARQLAGDLQPDANLEDHIATAFNRNHVINSEGGIIDEEYRVEYVADRVRTVSLAWLGLTMECARCHDHKFDPVAQRDYYQLFAFFNNVEEVGEDGRVDNAGPLMRAPTREQQRRYEQLLAREVALRQTVREQLSRELAAEKASPIDDSPPDQSDKRQASTSQPFTPALDALPRPLELPADASITATSARVDLNAGWVCTAWVKPAAAVAAPIISTQNFAVPASSQGYGEGLHVGLTAQGAVEVRLAVRWPGYALSLRSMEKLPPQQWRHIAIAGIGAKASGLRIFVDGVETETEVRHDDLVGSSRVDLQACKLEYSIVSPK